MSFSSDYYKEKNKKKKKNDESQSESKATKKSSFSDDYYAKKAERKNETADISPLRTEANKFGYNLSDTAVTLGTMADRHNKYIPIIPTSRNPQITWDTPSKGNNVAAETGKTYSSPVAEYLKDETGKIDLFQAGAFGEVADAFDDGFQLKDIGSVILGTGKAVAGTVADAAVDVAKGFVRSAEGVGDLLVYGASGVADLVGADEYAETVKENAMESLTDEWFGGADEFLNKYSVLGHSADQLGEGVGQLATLFAGGGALKALGAGEKIVSAGTLLGSGLSSMGSSMGEAYEAGATDGEAWAYGGIAGAADVVTEMLFGGMGKGINALGFSKGLSSADDMFAKSLSKNIKSQLGKNLAEYGIKSGAEGVEGVLAGFIQAAGKKMTYMSEEDFGQILKDENLLEQFIAEAFVSSVSQLGILPGTKTGSLIEANETGRDFITGLNKNETSVIDKEFEKRVAEEEWKKGGELTAREKNKLYDSLVEGLDKGYISTDTIEEVLGGDDYTAYNGLIAEENKVLQELAENFEGDELKAKVEEFLSGSNRSDLKTKLSENVFNLVKDSRLANSYLEIERGKKKFTADVNQYTDENARKTIQNIIDSGSLNNTNRAHELAGLLAKISADKGIIFSVTDAKKLAKTNLGVNGRTINGFVTESGITINVDSQKYLNSVVGHEVAHVLEGTKFYEEFQNAAIEFAKAKGEYKSRLTNALELYKDVDGYKGVEGFKKIKREVVADLVGDYLFTAPDFIKNLSVNHRNVFQYLYDEIKYLCKVATAGSKEARELERVKKAFEDAYRADGKGVAETKLSISKTSKMEYDVQLKQIEGGKLNGSNSLYVGYSVNLQNAGLSNAPYVMHQGDYRKSRREKANNKNYSSHSVPYDFFENLPNHLNNAPMLIDNGEKVTIVTSYPMVDTKGNDSYVIAGVLKDYDMNGETDKLNLIKSVYPWDDFAKRITKSAENGNLVVTNKNKVEQMLATIGIQPAEVSRILNLAKDSIPQNGENVKPLFSLSEAGLDYDSKSGTISYSLTSLNDAFAVEKGVEEYQAARAEYETALAKSFAEDPDNITDDEKAKASRYLDNLFLIGEMIANDRDRLDYEAAVNKSAWVSNSEYGGSVDFSTLCAKRRIFTGTFDAIQEALPDTVLTENDFLTIRNLLLEAKVDAPCSMCYVEGSRAKHGLYVAKFITDYKKTNPEWIPQIADFASANRLEQTRIQHPEAYEKYVEAMNKLSQRKPKEASVRTDYKGEILDAFKDNAGSVAQKNLNGGIRFNSFSDFEIIHALDCMQVLTDMSRVGLNGQAYTKVKEFAEAFGNTGLKINLSLVAKDVDENGNLVFDEVNGMKYSDANDLRNRYSENVGTVIVVFNDAQLKAALADGSIDYVLPFHRSQWKKSQYDAMGLPGKTKDYTIYQNDKVKNPKSKRWVNLGKLKHKATYTNDITGETYEITGNIMPNQYWDYNASGRENAQRYLDYINANGLAPKFYFLLDNVDGKWVLPDGAVGDGYFKLLIDFKMYNNEGWGSPQNPVTPEFNMPFIRQMLDDYKGGHKSFPVAQDVVDKFVAGKKKGKYQSYPEQIAPSIPSMPKFEMPDTMAMSLSAENEAQKRFGNFAISGEDVRYRGDISPVAPVRYGNRGTPARDLKLKSRGVDIAPVEQDVSPIAEDVTVSNAEQVDNAQMPDDLAPSAPVQNVEKDISPVKEQYEAIRPEPKKRAETDNKLIRVDDGSTPPKPNMEERSWYETSSESEAVDGAVKPDDIPDELRYYQVKGNKQTLDTANSRLNNMGYEKAVTYFEGKITEKRVTTEDIALGERLIQEAVKRGDTKTATDLIVEISVLGTELGQQVQALSIIKKLSPEGQLQALHRLVERGKAKGDKAFDGVEVTEDMAKQILETRKKDGTYDQKELNRAVEDVKQQIADQMSVSFADKANAWRYFSMLGNPKTHVRNVISNVANFVARMGKNAVARTMEDIALHNKNQNTDTKSTNIRTKTWKRSSADVKAYAKQVAKEMKDIIAGNAKYSDTSEIKQKRQIFKNKALNAVTDFNTRSMEAEDALFSRPTFERAFAEYLTANGIETEQDIQNNPELVEKAKVYALEEAKAATFRQDSYIANKISEIEHKNPFYGIAIGSIMPFKKTPINIAKAGVAYSPLGLARSLYDFAQVRKGNMDATTAIDHLAQGLTGTSLALIGYALASMGVLNGAGGEDKEGEYDYQLGEQSYSITLGDNTYSLSWLTPVSMPLFVGANAYEILVDQEDWDFDMVTDALGQTLDPMSEMSFLSSLDDVLSSYDSGVAKIWGAGESLVQNYATQYIPTLSSQFAQLFDDTKRSTKPSKDSGATFAEETWNKIRYKIPGLRNTLEPQTDIWGDEVKQTENFWARAAESFFSPWSKREDITTRIDEEIKDLYQETGMTELIPSIPNNYTNYKGEKYEMSAKEYTEYKQTYGQTAYDMMKDLFDTETYQNGDSELRADMVKRVYDYARDLANQEFLAGRDVDYTNTTEEGIPVYKEDPIKGAIENDMSPDEYAFYTKSPEKYEFLNDEGITYREWDSFDEETKNAYTWAYKNPDKRSLVKAVTNDIVEYRKLTEELYDIKADKDSNGKSISGSRKEKVIDYVNNLDIDYGERIILFKSEYPADDTYNYDIVEYLNGRDDISRKEMITILEELGMTVHSDGKVTW